jgi:ABC-type antimicrobial peptide transport system permease subunit
MLKSHLIIALRNLIRFKAFSSINILGLGVGIGCTILILLWVQDELSYDRSLKNAENIYMVLRGDKEALTAVTSRLLAPTIREELPEVADATNLFKLPESFNFYFRYGNKGLEERLSLADTNFFSVFSFAFREGDRATALMDPGSAVITDGIRKKYFGDDNAVGKTLSVTAFGKEYPMRVSAVVDDFPHNSTIQSPIIFPNSWLQSLGLKDYGWKNQSVQTFIHLKDRVRDDAGIRALSSQIKACELRHDVFQPETLEYSLLPLTRSHLYGGGIKFLTTTGDIKYVRIFLAIAAIILLIAGINYMNLTTALGLRRTKEVGIKKAVGASREMLVAQFLVESLVLAFIAMALAMLFVELFLPEFNQLSGKQLVIEYSNPLFVALILTVTVIAGLLSGSYPAFFLSSFAPDQVLKGKVKPGTGGVFTRKGLVVFQFALSIVMIICTIVVFNQLAFIRNSNLGFDKENVVCISLTGEANNGYETLKTRLETDPDILGVTRSESMDSKGWNRTRGVGWQGKQNGDNASFWVLGADVDLASTYRIAMSQGRFFSRQFPSDQTNAFVVNEAAVKAMGMKSPLNQDISVFLIDRREGKIIGVTKDFHFASFHTAVEPLIIAIPDINQQNFFYRTVSIRFRPGTVSNSLAFIEKTWKEQMRDVPFSYYFYDESLKAQYSAEQRMETIFKYFSFLAILIASLGLFGLASFSAAQRIKEIGIRKVLGATVTDITLILSREFVMLVVLSNVIAWPVAYYVMNRWLENFAYRTGISWPTFLLAGAIALSVALLTVSYQAIRAALANPVEALRYE